VSRDQYVLGYNRSLLAIGTRHHLNTSNITLTEFTLPSTDCGSLPDISSITIGHGTTSGQENIKVHSEKRKSILLKPLLDKAYYVPSNSFIQTFSTAENDSFSES
jgi:hypothetical protein